MAQKQGVKGAAPKVSNTRRREHRRTRYRSNLNLRLSRASKLLRELTEALGVDDPKVKGASVKVAKLERLWADK